MTILHAAAFCHRAFARLRFGTAPERAAWKGSDGTLHLRLRAPLQPAAAAHHPGDERPVAAGSLLYARAAQDDHQRGAERQRTVRLPRPRAGAGAIPVRALRPVPGAGADRRRAEIRPEPLCRHHRRADAAPPALPALPAGHALPAVPPAAGEPGRAGAAHQCRDRAPGRLRRRRAVGAGGAGRHPGDHAVLHVHAGLGAGHRRRGPLSLADLADPQAAVQGQPARQDARAPGAQECRADQRDGVVRPRHPRQRRHLV